MPMQAIPEEDNPPQGNESVDEFIEDDNDPDKAAEKQIDRVNNDYFVKLPMDEARAILASGEDEKILTENGAPTQADLMSMGQGAMNNMALKLGIREDVMRDWMIDETLHDLKDAVAQVIRSQIFVLITTPGPFAPDWKEISRRYQVGAQVKQERPEPKAMEIVNDKDRMARQIVSILFEKAEKDAPGEPSADWDSDGAASQKSSEGEKITPMERYEIWTFDDRQERKIGRRWHRNPTS